MLIDSIIASEESRLTESVNPNLGLNILYNLILIKNKFNKNKQNYTDFKKFINFYIEVVKLSDFGYDKLNYIKIETILNFLSFEEQISALNYAISVSSRELPEYNRDWFVERKHKAEVKHIFQNKLFSYYPKALLLFCGYNFFGLFFGLTIFFSIACVVLLPAPTSAMEFFSLKYEIYSKNFFLNHVLNVLSLFADLDNDFKVQPLNWLSLLVIIIGKLLFFIIIINFIFRKISDKINIK